MTKVRMGLNPSKFQQIAIAGPPGRRVIQKRHLPFKIAWDYVSSFYLDSWVERRHWLVRVLDQREMGRWDGFCVRQFRCIEISHRMASEGHSEMCALFNHEACHALAPCGHGPAWSLRIDTMIDRAVDMADWRIAQSLQWDLVTAYGRWAAPGSEALHLNSISDAFPQNDPFE